MLADEAADAIEELSMKLHGDEAAIAGMKREIERMIVADKPRWIPVTEQLPEEYVDVLCYCSRNGQYGCGEWINEDNGTIYWIGLNGMIPTHWMPLPEPPKEET